MRSEKSMFVWNDDMIRYLSEASAYGRYNEKIAERIAGRLERGAHVCDAGCGLGYLSLALAPCCGRVTAVDASEKALAVLRSNLVAAGIRNVEPVQADLFTMTPKEPYDAMAFCFFGTIEQTLAAVRTQCRGKAFLIKKNWDTHRFTLKERPLEKFTFARTCAALDRLGIPYETEVFPLEMGQPLRSLADAVAFFRLYGEAGEQVSQDNVRARLVETGDETFPYYLPANRPLGMVILSAGDIPPSLELSAPRGGS